jgi:ABC-type Fe3+ transport system permease subunit
MPLTMIIGNSVVGVPFVVQTTVAGLAQIEPHLA